MNTGKTLNSTWRLTLGLGLAMLGASALAQPPRLDPQQMFDRVDSDGDGKISYGEFSEANVYRFAEADSDGDGLLSYEELLASTPGPRGPGRRGAIDDNAEREARLQERLAERAAKQLADHDTDGDGYLSNLEMSEAAFLRMDSDGDGVLSLAEMKPPRREGQRGRPHRGPQTGQ